jgi:hypothetical protein
MAIRGSWCGLRFVLTSGAALAALSGCPSAPAPTAEREPQPELRRFILDAATAAVPTAPRIDYSGKAVLLGAEIEPAGPVRPGSELTVRLFWQCQAPLGASDRLFTHVVDEHGQRLLTADHVGVLRRVASGAQQLGPSRWVPGKIYVDEQVIPLPTNLPVKRIQILSGIWNGAERLPATAGPRDAEQRGVVASLEVQQGAASVAAPAAVPQLVVRKLPPGMRPKLDGKLDERTWNEHAALSGPFRAPLSGAATTTELGATARFAWDDQALYVAVVVNDGDVVGGFDPKAVDPHVMTRDSVQLFLDPDGDGDNRDYYEIALNPQNLVFDSRYDSLETPRTAPAGPFGREEWSVHASSAVLVKGTLDGPARDEGYVIEARLPWKSFDRAQATPPVVGDTWRINVIAIDGAPGRATEHVAWSPLPAAGSLHQAAHFGRVTWADEKGQVPTPQPAASATAAPGAAASTPKRAPKPAVNAPAPAVSAEP